MDQERINAMAKALLDMETLERTTTEGRRYVAERLLAADDAWRAAHAPEPVRTPAGDALAAAVERWGASAAGTGYGSLMQAVATYRSASAPAPIFTHEFNGRFYTDDQWDHAAGQPEWMSAEQSKQGDAPTPAILAGAELLRTLRAAPAPDRLAELAEAKTHWPKMNVEDVGNGPFIDDKEVFLGSIAISLKRLADAFATDRRGQVR